MSTLDTLQQLNDGEFHRLGDELLRRLEFRYRRLRTHGLNEFGQSIRGQPDSYVGDTANSCTIAVCYTTQKAGWWNKVVEDVREAVAASPHVTEIVGVIPQNAERDGPKDSSIDWLADAREAAGKASFRLIDGRDLVQMLNADHQDLRHLHLGMPYSHLTPGSILTSAQSATASVLAEIEATGRYDPDRYAPRSADEDLYRLWQRRLRSEREEEHRIGPVRMIALVNDSGVGKTSLVCSFASSLAAVQPVVLVQARDLALGTEDALVTHVIHVLQGVLDPEVRATEEVALTKHLAGTVLLTVVVDGLDETHDPNGVRKAINSWLRSRIGQRSILIVTSRREFWTSCSDQGWSRWMPRTVTDDRSPARVDDALMAERHDPGAGIRLPDRFAEPELEAAWVRGGRPRAELYTLSKEAREELRHPFTLRVYLQLYAEEGTPPLSAGQVDLMEQWLNRRLEAEALPAERITPSLFRQALRMIAMKIAETDAGALSVDNLVGLPRFDPAHPPGPVVERLIAANVLECIPGHSDRIRFAVEAVQDYYRGEADVEHIRERPVAAADRFREPSFSEGYLRLVTIGRRLINEDLRQKFVDRLTEIDPRMACSVRHNNAWRVELPRGQRGANAASAASSRTT